MRIILTFICLLALQTIQAQTATLKGVLKDAEGLSAGFASVALYETKDSNLVKVTVSNEAGVFQFTQLQAGNFFLKTSFVGYGDLVRTAIEVKDGQVVDMGELKFAAGGIELKEAVVTANRRMIEVKPDRTVFNVEGTINATGTNGLQLLRKAPGVQVDNNDNIVVLGRSGVLVYIDGKRLPLSGQDLSNYLSNLQAAQIDRIDIITNPGAKYEAEGNAGIIDIRLKRDKNFGANGSVNGSFSHGFHAQGNVQASGSYRNKSVSLFGTLGHSRGKYMDLMVFNSTQNDFSLAERVYQNNLNQGSDIRFGSDFFIGKKHTVGFLVSAAQGAADERASNRIAIAPQTMPSRIDSVLISNNVNESGRGNQAYNINYRFDNSKSRTINFDLDYGKYTRDERRDQPNRYFDATETNLLTERLSFFDTPSDIEIYTAKADYEEKLLGGQLGFGSKLSKVVSDNTFLFFNIKDGKKIRNDQGSNTFLYDENVYAGYVSYARELNKMWNLSAGLRAEKTDASGDLTTFDTTLQEPTVLLNYLSWFPSAGLTYAKNPLHQWAINYGRRINRPDYNVLNPFNNRLSELSYEKGNPFLKPEIVNNFELGYTLFYAFNFKLAYSVTDDQITRLIGPDDVDPRSSFISWDNLAKQRTTSLNISAPFDATKWWSIYMNANLARIQNEADYGNGAVVDIQVLNWNIYQQSTFSLPKGFKFEVSGWYTGPGVWGGVFLFEPMYSLDLGLQKKFLNDQLTLRLSASDVTYQSFWSGTSSFDGLISNGSGKNDSRRVALNVNYTFGNQNVKARSRNTGIEAEAGRVKK
jgi:iron complex outermembrane recepter protein